MTEDTGSLPADRHAKLLAFLAETGVPGAAIAMIDVFQIGGKLTADQWKFLHGPLVLHQSGWSDTLPDWMPAQARAERIEIVLGTKPWIIGPTELAAVMYGATLDHPLHREDADLYLWASTSAAARHYGKPIAKFWQKIGEKPIADDDVCVRGGRLWEDYRTLAERVRGRVIANAPKLKREAPAAAPVVVEAKAERKQAKPALNQLSMF